MLPRPLRFDAPIMELCHSTVAMCTCCSELLATTLSCLLLVLVLPAQHSMHIMPALNSVCILREGCLQEAPPSGQGGCCHC